jgi:hypothetical protein
MDRPVSASMPHLAQSAFRIELSLSISDAAALWAAALGKGLSSPGAVREDVVAVIGPAEDPDLAACLSLLAGPSPIPGCELHDFELVDLRAAPTRCAANDELVGERVGVSA